MKKTISEIALIISCLCLCSCGSTGGENGTPALSGTMSEKPKTESTTELDMATETQTERVSETSSKSSRKTTEVSKSTQFQSWQEAYNAQIEECKQSDAFKSDYARLDVIDLSGDGIPELILCPNGWNFEVYTFADHKAVPVKGLEVSDTLNYSEKYHLLLHYGARGDHEAYTFYRIENGTAEQLKSIVYAAYGSETNTVEQFFVDEVEADKQTYDEAMAEYHAFDPSYQECGKSLSFQRKLLTERTNGQPDWKNTYKNLLASKADSDTCFDLVCLDDDAIPELILSDGSYVTVYTCYSDGDVDWFSNAGSHKNDQNELLSSDQTPYIVFECTVGGLHHTSIRQLQNGELEELQYASTNASLIEDGQQAEYYTDHTDTIVSKADYEKALAAYPIDASYSGHGWQYQYDLATVDSVMSGFSG